MSNGLAYVEYRLNEWGFWCQKILASGLGFPSRSIVDKINEGGMQNFDPRKIQFPSNPQAEEMDDLITQLAIFYPLNATVIRIRYVKVSCFDDELKKLKIPKTTFKARLKEAKMWLSAKISN